MCLGTCALKVGREPEHLRHVKEVFMATRRVRTTPACIRQLAPSHWRDLVENTHLTPYLPKKRGGKGGSQNLQRFMLTTDLQRSAQNASMRCNISYKIIKRPLRPPQRSRTLELYITDCTGLQFNSTKITFSHILKLPYLPLNII